MHCFSGVEGSINVRVANTPKPYPLNINPSHTATTTATTATAKVCGLTSLGFAVQSTVSVSNTRLRPNNAIRDSDVLQGGTGKAACISSSRDLAVALLPVSNQSFSPRHVRAVQLCQSNGNGRDCCLGSWVWCELFQPQTLCITVASCVPREG